MSSHVRLRDGQTLAGLKRTIDDVQKVDAELRAGFQVQPWPALPLEVALH